MFELVLVSYKLGMLLKKCGFDELTPMLYHNDIQYKGRSISYDEQLDLIDEGKENKIVEVKGGRLCASYNRNSEDWVSEDCCSAPTLSIVEKWLREKYGIVVQIRFAYAKSGVEYTFSITNTKTKIAFDSDKYFSEYEDAESEAIEYAIEHYIVNVENDLK